MKKYPLVSVLIVNYNGKVYLNECLTSLFSINYPKDMFEVLLVDNDSQDDSVNFIKVNFPQVILIESEENLGFAGGNNLAFTKARGKYIVLLNNDTSVDKNWLTELVKTAQQNHDVGIVSSKLLFDIPFVELEINSETEVMSNIYIDSQEYSPYGVIIDGINCSTEEKNYYVWYKRGFYEPINGNYPSRWTDGHGVILLPYMDKKVETYQISLHGQPHTYNSKIEFEIKVAGKILVHDFLKSREVKQVNLSIDRASIKNNLIHLVQNAGNVIFKNGLGRDRGSVIKRAPNETKEFYDYDSAYYQEEKKIIAMCGASCLIKHRVITGNELFDPAYFMYYEDADLSLKVWRYGFNIIYQPKSIVYHKHRATTNKQSVAFFTCHTDKNHLFFLLTHFPLKIFLIQLIIFFSKYLIAVLIVFFSEKLNYYGKIYREYSVKLEARTNAFNYLTKNLKRIYNIRKELKKTEKRSFSDLYKNLY